MKNKKTFRKWLTNILAVTILVISIIYIAIINYSSIINMIFSPEICISTHCFEKPKNWKNISNEQRVFSYFFNKKHIFNESYIVLSPENSSLEITLMDDNTDYQNLPKNIKSKNFNENCTCFYEDHKNYNARQLVIKELNISLILPLDSAIEKTILSSICDK